jgi:hypothetical protein
MTSEKGILEREEAFQFSLGNGTEYSVGVSYTGVGSGQTRYLYIENPAESGKVLIVSPPTFRTDKRINVQLDFNPTEDTKGTAETPKNRRTDKDGNVANVFSGGAYTLNEPFAQRPLGSGQGANAFGGSDDDKQFAIAEGDSALFIATTTENDTDLTLGLDYAQLPSTILE